MNPVKCNLRYLLNLAFELNLIRVIEGTRLEGYQYASS
jgi:hypothetical protein